MAGMMAMFFEFQSSPTEASGCDVLDAGVEPVVRAVSILTH